MYDQRRGVGAGGSPSRSRPPSFHPRAYRTVHASVAIRGAAPLSKRPAPVYPTRDETHRAPSGLQLFPRAAALFYARTFHLSSPSHTTTNPCHATRAPMRDAVQRVPMCVLVRAHAMPPNACPTRAPLMPPCMHAWCYVRGVQVCTDDARRAACAMRCWWPPCMPVPCHACPSRPHAMPCLPIRSPHVPPCMRACRA
jgi:hypothetical protein